MTPRPLRSPRSRRPLLTLGATGAAASLVLLAAAPGSAAVPVARASATALELTVASSPVDSGTYAVSNDGRRETSTGSNSPALRALGGQSFLSAGTLAQDASTEVVDRTGRSAACAGLAGDGATLVAVGEGGCLTPGDNASISAGNLDLSDLRIVQSDLLAGMDQQLQQALQPVLDQVLPAAQDALQTVLTQVGDPEVLLDLGAIQSQCVAGPRGASGDAQLADAALSTTIAGRRVDLVALPVHPGPNTKVATDLDAVVTAVTDGLETELTTAFDGALSQVGDLVDQVEQALNDNVVSAVAAQLAPLEDNLLDGTLNKQMRPQAGAIEVTALELRVLPAAADFGIEPLSIAIGRTACGPSGRVAVPGSPAPAPAPTTPPPTVPTSVPAGLAAAPASPADSGSTVALGALAVALLVAGATGMASYRRARG